MQRFIGEATTNNPEITENDDESEDDYETLLVVSIRNDWSKGSGSSLPGQHLVLDLANLLLQILALGGNSLPD